MTSSAISTSTAKANSQIAVTLLNDRVRPSDGSIILREARFLEDALKDVPPGESIPVRTTVLPSTARFLYAKEVSPEDWLAATSGAFAWRNPLSKKLEVYQSEVIVHADDPEIAAGAMLDENSKKDILITKTAYATDPDNGTTTKFVTQYMRPYHSAIFEISDVLSNLFHVNEDNLHTLQVSGKRVELPSDPTKQPKLVEQLDERNDAMFLWSNNWHSAHVKFVVHHQDSRIHEAEGSYVGPNYTHPFVNLLENRLFPKSIFPDRESPILMNNDPAMVFTPRVLTLLGY